ncbi:helix-hairpin-helix domain-containing protein [Kitasatospora sp. NPDC004745]|uniref:helix-hairpin-helix domain-containing protein n=1 Tax=Kitasatospora sp. NPDC004745 TaxID=3364019 RepID=UPI003677F7CB
MTSLSLGAAKRHETDETVRLRMAALLPVDGDRTAGARAPVAGSGSGTGAPASGTGAPGSGTVTGEPPATGPPAGAGPPVGEGLPVPTAESGSVRGAPAPPSASDVPGAPEPPGPQDSFGPAIAPRFRFGAALALDRRAVAGLAVLLLFAVGYAVQHFWFARPQALPVPALASVPGSAGPTAAEPVVSPGETTAESAGGAGAGGAAAAVTGGPGPPGAPDAGSAVVVDVGGRVHLPGLHTLPGGSRVADALKAAGGPQPETDTHNLNLARVLTDGEQILVGESALAPAPAAGPGGLPTPAGPRPPVSLNRATLEQLDTLPGVGPTLAQRILAYRTSHGSFRSLDQLRQVSGIGARTFAELRPLLTL